MKTKIDTKANNLISRRTFINRSATYTAGFAFVPMAKLTACELQQAVQWSANATKYRAHIIGHVHIDLRISVARIAVYANHNPKVLDNGWIRESKHCACYSYLTMKTGRKVISYGLLKNSCPLSNLFNTWWIAA